MPLLCKEWIMAIPLEKATPQCFNSSLYSNTVRRNRRLGATREKSSRFGGATDVVEFLPVSHLPRIFSSVHILICGGV